MEGVAQDVLEEIEVVEEIIQGDTLDKVVEQSGVSEDERSELDFRSKEQKTSSSTKTINKSKQTPIWHGDYG